MNEEEVRMKLINPALDAAGWKSEQICPEYTFTDGQVIVQGKLASRGSRKRADYLLTHRGNDFPLAVIEAKDAQHRAGDGLQQAEGYARALGAPFAYSSNGSGFVEHDMLTGEITHLDISAFPTEETLWARYLAAKGLTPEAEKVISQPYHFDSLTKKQPRYYQRRAVDAAVEAVACGKRRLLLVMATGTGKTFTAFQIVWRLRQAGAVRRVLYLADRNILIDQTMQRDFSPLANVMVKVQNSSLDSSYEVYMCLYQQLTGEKDAPHKPYMDFKPDFFDLVIVDECHRGSAAEDSQWRSILEYFSPAIHIGMTATPKETEDVSNIAYFGEPIYTYSLKQGIEDGFLAPYKVIRVGIDKDLMGWRPQAGQTDLNGNVIKDEEYFSNDFDRKLIIDERIEAVAGHVTDWMKKNGRDSKAIVFCVDIDHAERMREALINANSDLMAQDSRYVMRITGDEQEGKKQLDNFIDPQQPYPTIVTTSELLTTGVDAPTVKLIVLDSVINSMTKFKQIIGRGTRLYPRGGKEYFTIMDFRGVCRLFADPAFDGEPITDEPDEPPESPKKPGKCGTDDPPRPKPGGGNPEIKYHVNGVDVTVIGEVVRYIDPQTGKLTTEDIRDYSRKNIIGQYATLRDFLTRWDGAERKQALLEELKERGVFLDALREEIGQAAENMDDFDLIIYVAYDQKPLTRRQRVEYVKKQNCLQKYSADCREVLSALMEKYSDVGIVELENPRVLDAVSNSLKKTSVEIIRLFGGAAQYRQAVRELTEYLYSAA